MILISYNKCMKKQSDLNIQRLYGFTNNLFEIIDSCIIDHDSMYISVRFYNERDSNFLELHVSPIPPYILDTNTFVGYKEYKNKKIIILKNSNYNIDALVSVDSLNTDVGFISHINSWNEKLSFIYDGNTKIYYINNNDSLVFIRNKIY